MTYNNRAVVGIGGNLPSLFGDCRETVMESVRRIAEADGLQLISRSPLYRSKAWPEGSDQPDYANMAVLVETSMEASQLLECLQAIENAIGRVRGERWGARVIDLDLLACGDLVLPNKAVWSELAASNAPDAFIEDVTLPHPRLHKRLFAARR